MLLFAGIVIRSNCFEHHSFKSLSSENTKRKREEFCETMVGKFAF